MIYFNSTKNYEDTGREVNILQLLSFQNGNVPVLEPWHSMPRFFWERLVATIQKHAWKCVLKYDTTKTKFLMSVFQIFDVILKI